MKIFTIQQGVIEGATVGTLEIKSANVKIPVIQVGEEGRGSQLASVAVQLPPADADEVTRSWFEMILFDNAAGVARLRKEQEEEDAQEEE